MLQLIERDPGLTTIDGSGTWKIGTERNQLPVNCDEFVEVPITIGDTSYLVKIAGDDPDLIDLTRNYHDMSNALLPRPSRVSPTTLEVFYTTQFDLKTDQGVVRRGENPYVAVASQDGTQVLATGKPSVGTLKSISFGIASTEASRDLHAVPLHASIGTFDGTSAFAFSGRGNWGKTTSMIATKLFSPDVHVITDDWSMVNPETRRITPVDMLVAVRPEAVSGILAATGTVEPPKYLYDAQKDNGTLFTIHDIFGEVPDCSELRLDRVFLTDKRENHANDTSVYPPDGLDAAFRLMDDAYHSPDIWGTYRKRYEKILEGLSVAAFSTSLQENLRATQLAQILNSIKNS